MAEALLSAVLSVDVLRGLNALVLWTEETVRLLPANAIADVVAIFPNEGAITRLVGKTGF